MGSGAYEIQERLEDIRKNHHTEWGPKIHDQMIMVVENFTGFFLLILATLCILATALLFAAEGLALSFITDSIEFINLVDHRIGNYLGWLAIIPAGLAVWIFRDLRDGLIGMFNIGENCDRFFFRRCIKEARNTDELEEVGLPLPSNIVDIVADEFSEEWDVFFLHREARCRMLKKLHKVADLRKLADDIEQLEDEDDLF